MTVIYPNPCYNEVSIKHLVIPRVVIHYLNPWPHNDTFFRLSMTSDENSNNYYDQSQSGTKVDKHQASR